MRISKEKVLLLHQLIAQETGGDAGVRDIGLLESAIDGIYATFDGEELYKTKVEKGARLGYSLISNHAFVDGNKRIGVYVMLTFMETNGLEIDCTDDEIIKVGMNVASGEMDYKELVKWLEKHIS